MLLESTILTSVEDLLVAGTMLGEQSFEDLVFTLDVDELTAH